MSDPTRWDEHATLSIDGSAYEVTRVHGEEGVSRLFRYDVTLATPHAGADPKELLGREAELALRDGFGGERPVRGLVAEARLTVEDSGKPRLLVVVRPRAYLLSIGRTCRVFQDATVVDIVKSVCEHAGVKARFALTRTYSARVYTAQFEEPSWAFISRLCEEEGIYAWFDHGEGESIVVFADSSISSPDLVGGPRVAFMTGAGTRSDVETIRELGAVVEVTSTRFSLGSFDPSNPRFKMAAHAGEGDFLVYDAPGHGPEDTNALAAQAATMTEAARAARATVSGTSTSARLTPGRSVEVVGHPAARFERRFFVTELTVDVVQRQHGNAAPAAKNARRARQLLRLVTEARLSSGTSPTSLSALTEDAVAPADGRKFRVTFRALDGAVPFRAPLTTPTPARPGLQTGIVVGPPGDEVYPDATGRVRVQLHWDREGRRNDRSGRWMRVTQRGTAGSMLLPRMGWNVVTMNLEGAPDLPVVVSRLYDAEHPPPYALPDNMTRQTFKTATTPAGGGGDPIEAPTPLFVPSPTTRVFSRGAWNEGSAAGGGGGDGADEIRYENKAGAQEMFINASGDMSVLVQNAKSEDIKSNAARDVGANWSLEVGQNYDQTVGGNQLIVIGGNDTETVGKARDKSVGANESSTIAASRHLTVKGSHETSAKGTRDLSVGVAQIDLSLGDIQLKTAMLKEFVGVAVVRITPRDITESVGAMSISPGSIAAKLGAKGLAAAAASAVNLSVSVGGVIQTIGGAKIEIAPGERSITVKTTYSETVGGAIQYITDGSYTDQAKTHTITAHSELVGSSNMLFFEAEERIDIDCGDSLLMITKNGVLIQGKTVDLTGTTIVASGSRIDHNV